MPPVAIGLDECALTDSLNPTKKSARHTFHPTLDTRRRDRMSRNRSRSSFLSSSIRSNSVNINKTLMMMKVRNLSLLSRLEEFGAIGFDETTAVDLVRYRRL